MQTNPGADELFDDPLHTAHIHLADDADAVAETHAGTLVLAAADRD